MRWFIWAKDDEANPGTPIDLEEGVDGDYNGTTFLGGATYYFISECVLDASKESAHSSIIYCNEGDGFTNFDGLDSSDYATSNIRNYLTGGTVRASLYFPEDWISPDGAYCNMYKEYNLTSDAIFNKITSRSLEDLYLSGTTNELPSAYAGQSDKFWLLSYDEVVKFSGARYGNISAKLRANLLSNKSTAYDWWLRTNEEYGIGNLMTITAEAYGTTMSMWEPLGARPAFTLAI